MAITRIESILFGADDLQAGIKYFDDWGLETVERNAKGATFRTLESQTITVRDAAEPGLTASPEGGSSLRETIWGVDTKASLEAIGAELSKDRQITRDADGTIHSRDDTGFAVGFRVANRTEARVAEEPYNLANKEERLNRRVEERRARPIRIGHVVYAVPTQDWEKQSDFYLKRLNFRLTDRSLDLGDFMRCDGAHEHHNLGLFHFGPKARTGHIAFEVRDMDEIMFGGQYMKKQGWKPANRPGRRIVGSNLYWNFFNPCGGNTEYFADMDRMDDKWQTRVWEKHPGGDLWSMDEPFQAIGQGA
jgi:catechol 2,3-dioxygenase-like lactoylglutathione lyase family enzyme